MVQTLLLFSQSRFYSMFPLSCVRNLTICFINWEHAVTTQRALIFFLSVFLLFPTLSRHDVCLYFIKNFFRHSVFKFVLWDLSINLAERGFYGSFFLLFTNHRTGGEGGGLFFNSSVPLHRHLDIRQAITAEQRALRIR